MIYVKKDFFTYKAVDFWNRLLEEIVGRVNLNILKTKLAKYCTVLSAE